MPDKVFCSAFSDKITPAPSGLNTNTGSSHTPHHFFSVNGTHPSFPHPQSNKKKNLKPPQKEKTLLHKFQDHILNIKLHFCTWWNLYKLQPEHFTNTVSHTFKKINLEVGSLYVVKVQAVVGHSAGKLNGSHSANSPSILKSTWEKDLKRNI